MTYIDGIPKDSDCNQLKNTLHLLRHKHAQYTTKIQFIGKSRSEQKVKTKTRLLLKEQSDFGLQCLSFQTHLSMEKTCRSIFMTATVIIFDVPSVIIFSNYPKIAISMVLPVFNFYEAFRMDIS